MVPRYAFDGALEEGENVSIEAVVYRRLALGEPIKEVLSGLGIWHCRNCTLRNFSAFGQCEECGTSKGIMGIDCSVPDDLPTKTGIYYDEKMLLHEVRIRLIGSV